MSLLDSTYFIGQIHIPSSKYKTTQEYIDRHEKKIIMDLFGYELGTLILDYDANSPQRIKDIVEGKEFTPAYGDYTGTFTGSLPSVLKWNGLLNSSDKESLLAYWVFYWYMREEETKLSISGSGKPKGENSFPIGNNSKAVYAWNKMMDLYGGFDWESPINPSCFNFMYANMDIYPEWIFKRKRHINRIGS